MADTIFARGSPVKGCSDGLTVFVAASGERRGTVVVPPFCAECRKAEFTRLIQNADGSVECAITPPVSRESETT